MIAFDGFRGETGNAMQVTLLRLSEIMQVTVQEDKKAAVLKFCVFAGLRFLRCYAGLL